MISCFKMFESTVDIFSIHCIKNIPHNWMYTVEAWNGSDVHPPNVPVYSFSVCESVCVPVRVCVCVGVCVCTGIYF